MSKNKQFLCLLTLLLSNQAVNSEVYKWIDENGKIVYSDKPGANKPEKVIIKKSVIQGTDTIQQFNKQKKLLGIMQEERDQKMALKQQEKEKKLAQQQKCASIKKKFQKIKEAGLLYEKTDDPYNPRIFSTEERKAKEDRHERYIKENC